MRRLYFLFIIIFVCITIGYDLKIGTMPHKKNTAAVTSQQKEQKSDLQFKKMTIEAGDTVLSVIEDVNQGFPNKSIKQMIKDFENLNPNTNPSKIQIGKTYKFPLY